MARRTVIKAYRDACSWSKLGQLGQVDRLLGDDRAQLRRKVTWCGPFVNARTAPIALGDGQWKRSCVRQ